MLVSFASSGVPTRIEETNVPMTDEPKKRSHDPSKKSIARWINEGGAPKGVDRSTHKSSPRRRPNQKTKTKK